MCDEAPVDETEAEHSTQDTESCLSLRKPAEPQHSGIELVLNAWRWELSIWFLETAGLIANLALLIRFNGVEQSAWKADVQITAFAAALAQSSQTALLVPTGSCLGQLKWRWLQQNRKAIDLDKFDLASRGPDGSLRLLWHLKLRPHLATLGALCTLLLLAFSTFVQQSVAVRSKRIAVNDPENASHIRLATDARTINLMRDRNDSFAIFQAMYSPYINPANVSGYCLSNFCTWDLYQTLSVCATVDGATHLLRPGNMSTDNTNLPPWICKQPQRKLGRQFLYSRSRRDLSVYLRGDRDRSRFI